jgi:hypothetical protein
MATAAQAARRIVRAHVVEQMPHPMFGPAPFVIVQFESWDYVHMDRRRIKREKARAIRNWRKGKSDVAARRTSQ